MLNIKNLIKGASQRSFFVRCIVTLVIVRALFNYNIIWISYIQILWLTIAKMFASDLLHNGFDIASFSRVEICLFRQHFRLRRVAIFWFHFENSMGMLRWNLHICDAINWKLEMPVESCEIIYNSYRKIFKINLFYWYLRLALRYLFI